MGYPYFNPPYNQKITKIEEGNFFVASGGIEPDSVRVDLDTGHTKMIQMVKIAALLAGVAAAILFCVIMA